MPTTERHRPLFVLAVGAGLMTLASQGCVRAEVAVVSQHTALERQAAGEYPERETELDDAAIEPGPEAIPREALAETGEGGELGVVAQLVARAETDDERIEALLSARCLGEAVSGLLVARPDDCRADLDAEELARLVARENLHRRQLWEFLSTRAEGTSTERARETWRELHLMRVPCGAMIEAAPDRWEAKVCER
ncbi:MAG: DUF1318 domain-containing protein [Myxococcales bacterium]|nr:DUF1318 domain-containing protein [Myxococcales bacterium]